MHARVCLKKVCSPWYTIIIPPAPSVVVVVPISQRARVNKAIVLSTVQKYIDYSCATIAGIRLSETSSDVLSHCPKSCPKTPSEVFL